MRIQDAPDKLRRLARERSRAEVGDTGYRGTRSTTYCPPPDHRRCSHVRFDGSRCRQWTVVGAAKCVYHRGRQHSFVKLAMEARERRAGSALPELVDAEVKMFYNGRLSSTLRERLRACLDMDRGEQTSLLEDVALMRQTVGDAAERYDEAVEMHLAATTPEERRLAAAMRLDAGKALRDCQRDLFDAVDKVERHAAMQAQRTGVSVHAIAEIARQFTALAYKACGDDLALAREIADGVRNIKLPNLSQLAAGTNITPDQDVLAMDDTVPRIEEGSR